MQLYRECTGEEDWGVWDDDFGEEVRLRQRLREIEGTGFRF